MRGAWRACVLALLLAGAVGGGGLSAQELEELRPGMDEFAAASVYTRYRSCSNAAFVDEPGRMAWSAPVLGRPAEVEIRFESGRAALVAFSVPLLPGERPDDALGVFEAALAAIWGPPTPSASPAAAAAGAKAGPAAGVRRWLLPGILVELAPAGDAGISISYRVRE